MRHCMNRVQKANTANCTRPSRHCHGQWNRLDSKALMTLLSALRKTQEIVPRRLIRVSPDKPCSVALIRFDLRVIVTNFDMIGFAAEANIVRTRSSADIETRTGRSGTTNGCNGFVMVLSVWFGDASNAATHRRRLLLSRLAREEMGRLDRVTQLSHTLRIVRVGPADGPTISR